MRNTVLGLLAVIALTGCGSEPESPPSVPVSPAHGLFLTHCVSCHQGPGHPPGPNAVILGSPQIATEKEFVKFLRQPTSAMMPPFSREQLTDGEAHELYVYLKSVVTPQPSQGATSHEGVTPPQ